MDHYAPQTRKEVVAQIDTEIAKLDRIDRKDILRSIFEASHIAEYNDFARLQTTIARFATLLVSLGFQADRIQRWIMGFTIVIAVMTLGLLALTGVMLYKMP